MLRDGIRHGTEMGKGVEAAMHAGSLVSDELVNGIVVVRLGQPDAANGFVLDGYPRTRAQADYLCQWLDGRAIREVVIHLAVDYNVIFARLTGRRQCPHCGTLYNIVSRPPKQDGLCDLDGEKLVVRDDDSEAVIRERLSAYERQTRPVLDFYRESGRELVEVDASYDPPDVVFQKICQVIEPNDRAENAG